MKRTSIVIDEALVKKCMKATGIKTMRQVVDHALRELLRHERHKDILKLKGRVTWQGDLDRWRQGRYT